MQIFVYDEVFVKVYPMTSVRKFPAVLQEFAKDVGAPDILVADRHHSNKRK